jgi:hypothetical protein
MVEYAIPGDGEEEQHTFECVVCGTTIVAPSADKHCGKVMDQLS